MHVYVLYIYMVWYVNEGKNKASRGYSNLKTSRRMKRKEERKKNVKNKTIVKKGHLVT